jgi:hypothetical protein
MSDGLPGEIGRTGKPGWVGREEAVPEAASVARIIRGGLSSVIVEAAMKAYELEIPGILTWKFKTLEEAVNRTVPLMIRCIPAVQISRLDAGGGPSVVMRLDSEGGACPFCRAAESVIRIWSDMERFDRLRVCRDCRRSFREYPSRVCGADVIKQDAGRG